MQELNDWLQQAHTYHQAGQLTAAEALYGRILTAQPRHSEALFLLGALHCQRGSYDTASHHLHHALTLCPKHASGHNNLGFALQQQGHLSAAVASYQQALVLNPAYAEAYYNLGNTYKALRHLDAARASYDRALALKPAFVEVHNNLGVLLQELEELDAAVACFRQALALRPTYAEAYNNLGVALRDQGEIDAALVSYEAAVALRPTYAEAYNNLGVALRDRGDFNAALASFTRAVELAPDFAEAHFSRALLCLATGNLERGWPAYEWRFRACAQPQRHFQQPLWDGTTLAGRTVLVHAEQGVGDELLFASCLPDLIAQAAHVVIECDPRLAALFTRSFPTATVHGNIRGDDLAWLAQLPPIDVQIAAGSLPRYLRPALESFPTQAGYLAADPIRQAHWAQRLARLGPGPKVGIAWRSRAARQGDPYYTQLEQWGAILRVPGVTFVNLQYDEPEAELAHARQQWGTTIQAWADLDIFHDLDGLAALIATLDLVIAPEMSVAALAGSLGKAVWQLLTREASWTMLGMDTHPWFPSIQAFCQTQHGNWTEVLGRVASALGCLAPSEIVSLNTIP